MNNTADTVGVVVFLIMAIVAIGAVMYGLNYNKPSGEISPLYDSNGTPVLDQRGNQLYVDEKGKVISHERAMKYYRGQEDQEGCGCLSIIALSFLFSIFK